MSKGKIVVITVIAVLAVVAVLFFGLTAPGREIWNNYTHGLHKADEVSYETRKTVEDTARSYISSYNADVAIYQSYKNSEDENMKQYAETAKIRAIRTATTYNEYILKNSYVWQNNVPADIYKTLDVNIE